MGLYSYNGLLMMLLFHLCRAQDAALPSPDPESAPPSLGDVINAVKVAFEQAIQISTEGTVHKTPEQAAEELAPRKSPAEQSPAAENVAAHTAEAAAAVRVSEEEALVLTAGEPDAHMSESNEQTDEKSVQGQAEDAGVTQDTDEEPAQESFQEASVLEPVKITKESVESGIEIAQSVQEPVKSGVGSDLQGPQIAEEAGAITEFFAEDTKTEESPVQAFTADTQNENKTVEAATEINGGGKEFVKAAGESEEEFVKEEVWKPHVSEMEKIAEKEKGGVAIREEDVKLEGLQEDENVKMQPGAVEKTEEETESQLSQEERQAGAAEEGTDGGVVVETEEQLEKKQGAEEVGEDLIKAETEGEKFEAQTELHTILGEEEVPPTRKTLLVETQQEPEVTVDTKGLIKLQKPVIMKSESTGGTTHEVNDVNEIITSRDLMENDHGEPALLNTVEKLLPAPTLGPVLRNIEEPAEEPDDSIHSKASGQEAWKIGAIAAAVVLILQTAVTIVYILKCRRKPNSTATPKKVCARGNRGTEYDDTTIPIDEETGLDDLPEYSQVQQEVEDVAMTTTLPDSSEKNSSHDLRTSVV